MASYTMPLDMLERKYYPISADCQPIGNELTFEQVIQSMKGKKPYPRPNCSTNVLPTGFVSKSDKVPSYTIDGFTITFDPKHKWGLNNYF